MYNGDIIFTVAPVNMANYIGKVKASNKNSGKIAKGQKVFIRLENYPHPEYGMLLGEVKYVSLVPR